MSKTKELLTHLVQQVWVSRDVISKLSRRRKAQQALQGCTRAIELRQRGGKEAVIMVLKRGQDKEGRKQWCSKEVKKKRKGISDYGAQKRSKQVLMHVQGGKRGLARVFC